MTNLNQGNYPIEYNELCDIDNLITNKCQEFDVMWKNHYSFHPAVCSMTWEQREEMKKFAWFIFVSAVNGFMDVRDVIDNHIQDTANAAYRDGLKDSKERFIGDARRKIQEVVDKL